MRIILEFENNKFQMLIDERACFPEPLAAPIQYEWLYQAMLWHMERRGYEGEAALFREPFTESPYQPKNLRKIVYRKEPATLTLEDIGL